MQGVQGALGLGREELTGVGGRMVNKFKGLFYWFFFHGRQCDPPLYLFPETCSGIYITHWRFGNGNCARRGQGWRDRHRVWVRSPDPCVASGHTCSLYLRAPTWHLPGLTQHLRGISQACLVHRFCEPDMQRQGPRPCPCIRSLWGFYKMESQITNEKCSMRELTKLFPKKLRAD